MPLLFRYAPLAMTPAIIICWWLWAEFLESIKKGLYKKGVFRFVKKEFSDSIKRVFSHLLLNKISRCHIFKFGILFPFYALKCFGLVFYCCIIRLWLNTWFETCHFNFPFSVAGKWCVGKVGGYLGWIAPFFCLPLPYRSLLYTTTDRAVFCWCFGGVG